jgi:hypothetical protein
MKSSLNIASVNRHQASMKCGRQEKTSTTQYTDDGEN